MASTTKNLEVSQQYMKQLSQIRGMFSFLVPDDGEDDENDDRWCIFFLIFAHSGGKSFLQSLRRNNCTALGLIA